MKPTVIVGIDPGNSGAVAYLRCADRTLCVRSMPLVTKKIGRKEVDIDVLSTWHWHPTYRAIVENVGAHVYVDRTGVRRGQGASASFAFGKGFGAILGILAAKEVPFTLVSPGVWKSMLNLSTSKDMSRQRAAEIFPIRAADFSRKKDDGKAEAALLAWLGYKAYYLQQMNNELGE